MWDDDIGDVARRLTAAPPPAHLRARVVARIGHDARGHARRLWWVLSPVAVAIVVVIAIILRGGSQPPAPQATAHVASDVTLPTTTHPATRGPEREPPIVASAVRPPQRRAAGPNASQAPESIPASFPQIESIPVASVAVEPIRVDTVPLPDAIELTTLSMTPLELTVIPNNGPRGQ